MSMNPNIPLFNSRPLLRSTARPVVCLLLLAASVTQSGIAPAPGTHLPPPQPQQPAITSQVHVTPLLCPDVVAPPGVDTLDIQAVADRWPLTNADPDPDGNPATPNYEARYDIDQNGDVDVVDIMLTPSEWDTIGAPPGIEITSVPTYGVWGVPLRGRVGCVDPAAYHVAVYIFSEGWWTKPTFASPLTIINPDGTWQTNVTTGGCDQLATRFTAVLLPNGAPYAPASGSATIPASMLAYPHVIVSRQPGTRTVQFSDSIWVVKSTGTCRTVGPGPNYFSDAPGDVYVDPDGRLHLTISYHDGRWWSSEVINTDPVAYGVYTFTLASRVDTLDSNAVAGLFTWDELGELYSHSELDVEFSRWGVPAAVYNAQYVVQPYQPAGHRHQFYFAEPAAHSTHSFSWTTGRVQFDSYGANPATPLESYTYVGSDVPPAGLGNARINLWLYQAQPPSNGQDVEIVVEAFEFTPVMG